MTKEEKAFKYRLPSENGETTEHITNCNSIIIIGANGSGKSKLGAWIEDQDPENVHRIGAQRNLNFNPNLPLSNYDDAKNKIIYGTDDEDTVKRRDKGVRWNWGKSKTTKMIDDFDDVLAALIAMYYNETSEYYKNCKNAEKNNLVKPKTHLTVIDKLMKIWNSIFPQRNLLFEDSKFYAHERSKCSEKYSANQMSDGERSVLYLASQVLAIPENETLVIDEPEIHLHGSIMNKLWESLEEYRADCFFIYITHDTSFAASHKSSDKIWLKQYDGHSWDLEKIESTYLPENLLFDILGSRKNVIFVEGEENSFDTQLYSLVYPEYLIIPCGSCSQVIMRTKSFNSTQFIHNFKVYGIIDRDFRTDEEIEKLSEDYIYTIKVAEVENLFIVKELIEYVSNYFAKDFDDVLNKIKNYIIDQRLKNQINKQVSKFVVSHIKYQLSIAEILESDPKQSVNNVFKEIDVNKIYDDRYEYYRSIIDEKNYEKTLEVFNEKDLTKCIGQYFDIDNRKYLNMVISILQREGKDKVINIFERYLPSEIPVK